MCCVAFECHGRFSLVRRERPNEISSTAIHFPKLIVLVFGITFTIGLAALVVL